MRMVILNDEIAVNPTHVVALHTLSETTTLVELTNGNRLEIQLRRVEIMELLEVGE